MKKSVVVIMSVLAVILLVCVAVLAMKYRQQTARYEEKRQAEEAVRNQFDAALQSIAEIQDSLNAIAPEETRLRRLQQVAETGNVTQTQKERMLSTIADLRESIRNTGLRIKDLERSLKGSEAEVAGLRRVIDGLKRSIAEKEAMVRQLTARVDSLKVTVAGLQIDVRVGQEKIAQQQQTIEEKRREIGTIYYVIGTKRELQDMSILVQKGGFLGIGKSPQLTGTFNQQDFTALDTDQETVIQIGGKEPQVLSDQSRSSYELQVGENGSSLRITDPSEFRRVKYLVIMIKPD